MVSLSHVRSEFKKQYGSDPVIVASAPGRVNMIGEHTDYNGGFVLPTAINREMVMAASPNNSQVLRLYAGNMKSRFEIELDAINPEVNRPNWVSYFLAVVDEFRQLGGKAPVGLDVYLLGDIPLGAGLSSSAAYEVCAGVMWNHFLESGLSLKDIALLAQRAEHSPYVGVQCGIMDQFVSALSQEKHLIRIDCHSLEYEPVPMKGDGACIVIINSMKRRGLVDSEYNQRRNECDEGLKLIQELSGKHFETLRHIPMDVFHQYEEQLPELVCKRVRHNLTENERVLEFSQAVATSDWNQAGELLYASHESLRDDFQVSCDELDLIVEIARKREGVYGCRMTGAGFGGCVVALVHPEQVNSFTNALMASYTRNTGKKPEIYVTTACQGAHLVNVP